MTRSFESKTRPGVFFAGQITGVEGYLESCATGLLVGVNIARRARGQAEISLSPRTALGSLVRYVTDPANAGLQPMNANYGIMELPEERDKQKKRALAAERSIEEITSWKEI